MSESKRSVRFPGESESYRAARNELLEAEIQLRRNIEAVATKRRELPLGGKVEQDYVFDQSTGPNSTQKVRLSDLFAEGKDTLIIYSFMFGPQMTEPCVMCTSMIDGLNGQARHVEQRVNLAVVARSPVARIMQFARERGWTGVRLLSSSDCDYNRDYHAETEDGNQWPALNVFVRWQGAIHHFYNAELLYAPSDAGQNQRHVDLIWPLWNLFDLTPDGRGEKWYPRLSY
jgi:predicted dithiol-disulfide oxidoreductase (DUF899 family)